MEITFADGKKDKILLAKSKNGGVDVPCLFSGVLDKDHDSEVIFFKLPNTPPLQVDVDGCKNSAETIVEIHSIYVPCGFVDLLLTKVDPTSYPARALRALGLLLADGAPIVGGGKTF